MGNSRILSRRQERRILARFPVSHSAARIVAALAFGEKR